MAVKFANLASSTLSGAITNSATSITVSDASSFPTLGSGDYFYASLGEGVGSEIVKVTAISTNTLTVTRGQDGTSAQAWSSGTVIALRVVAAALDDIASQAQTAADTESVSIDGDTMTGALTVPSITVGDGHTIGDDADDNLEITGSAGENVIIKSGVSTYLRTNGNSNALVIGSSLTSYFYGHVVPNTGGSRDLGTSGTRWRDIFTGTLNASGAITARGDSGSDSIVRIRNTNSTSKITRLQFEDSSGTVGDGLIAYDHSDASSANHYLGMGVNNNTAFKIDNNDNATFAGTIDAGGRIKATNWIELESAGSGEASEEAGIRFDYNDSALWYLYKDNANGAALHIQSAAVDSDGSPRVRFNRTVRETYIGGALAVNQYSVTSGYYLDVAGNIRMAGTEFRMQSSADSNLGLMIRDNTYATHEMDITSTRLGSGATTTLGLAGQNGINFYTAGTKVLDIDTSGNSTFTGHIITNTSSRIENGRISMEADGTLDWGSSKNYGTLTWDTNKIIVRATSGNAIEFQTNGSSVAATFDTSGNADFTGDVDASDITASGHISGASGSVSGKFAVQSTSVHASYDLYNNGTTYLNGSTIVDDALTLSGSSAQLVISGQNTSVNTANPAFRRGSAGEAFIDAPGHVVVNVDSNSNNTDRYFGVSRDAQYNSPFFTVSESGKVHLSGDDTYIQVGGTGGKAAVMGNTYSNNGSALDYRAYWAYDSYWDGSNWQGIRTNLGRKWMFEMGYHGDSFQLKRFDGTISGGWADSDWGVLFSVNNSGTGTLAESLIVGGGHNISWGGTYGSGKPTIAANSNTLYFYPTGNVSGSRLYLNATKLHSEGDIESDGEVKINDGLHVYGGGTYTDAGQQMYLHTDASGYGRLAVHDMRFMVGANNSRTTTALRLFSTGAAQFGGDVSISGDLTVLGDTITANVGEMTVEDNNITLNYHASNDTSSTADGAGITIQDAVNGSSDASIAWNASGDYFNFSHHVHSPGLTVDYTGHRTGDAGILVTNDASDWGIKIDKDGTDSYGLLVQADGDQAIMVRNSSGVQQITMGGGGQILTTGALIGNHVKVQNTSPTMIINDTNATNATNQIGYISFQRNSTETAWIGYGGTSNADFQVRNTEGFVTVTDRLRTPRLAVGTDNDNAWSTLWVERDGIDLVNDWSFEDASNPSHLTLAGTTSHVRMLLGTMDVSPYGVYIQGTYDNTPDNSGSGSSGTEPILLNPKGGNVGIGITTAPTHKLQVAGYIKSTGLVVNGDATIDAGTNTDLNVVADDGGIAQIRLYGDSQGTGRVYVGQSTTYGGGIEYNGDGSPSTIGAPADSIALYRMEGGTDYWTAYNYYSQPMWHFRNDIYSGGQIRATGWYGSSSEVSDRLGLAAEIGVSAGRAHLISYNRTTSQYGNLTISAPDIQLSYGTGDVTIKSGKMGIGLTDWDTTNLALDINGHTSIRRGHALYLGVNSNTVNSWQAKLWNSGSTAYLNAQTFIFSNAGYGSSTFFTSDSSGMNIQTGGLLINGTSAIDSSRNITAGTISSGAITSSGDVKLNGDSNKYAAAVYKKTVTGVSNSSWTTAFTVDSAGLGATIKASFVGTTGSVVVNTTADIIVGHFQDILIHTKNQFYTILSIKVTSTNNEDFAVELKTNSANAVALAVEVFPQNGEIVTFTSSHSFTGATHTHVGKYGESITGGGGNSGGFHAGGNIDTDSNFQIGGTTVIDSSRNATVNTLNVGTGSNTGVINLKTYDDAANEWNMYTWTDDTFRLNYNGSGGDEFILNSSGNATFAGAITSSGLIKGTRVATSAHVDYAQFHMPSWSGHTGYLKSLVWNDDTGNIAAIGAEYDGSKTNIHFHSQYNSGYESPADKTFTVYGNGNVNVLNNFLINGTQRIAQNGNATLGTISSGAITSSADLTLTGNGTEIRFTGGNNRILFSGYRALEGSTDGATLQIGEGYTTAFIQCDANLSSGHSYQINGTTVIDSSANITSPKLNVASGAYEGSIVFGTSNSWHSGIRQHDDGDAELRIWHKHGTRGRIHIATAYDGEPATLTRPTTGIIVYGSGGDVGIGDFSATTPSEKLHVMGNIIARSGTPKIAAVSTDNTTNASLRATVSSTDANGMYFDYHPNSAVGFIDNTYPRTAGQVYGDIIVRQKSGSTLVDRLLFDNDADKAVFKETLEVDSGTTSTLRVLCDDSGTAEIEARGEGQGTGRLFVGQSVTYGGGIEYNGDNSPATSGAGGDFITLYRREGGTNSWTAKNYYSNNNWEFRGNVKTGDAISLKNNAVYRAAHFAQSGNSTGAILIQLPGSRSSNWSMPVIRVTVYEYSADAHNVYLISGHNWTSGWYNNAVTHTGNNPELVKLVGNSSTNKDGIIIGGTGTSRSYLHVTVDVLAHPQFYNSNQDFLGSWSVGLITSESGWGGTGNLTKTSVMKDANNTIDVSGAKFNQMSVGTTNTSNKLMVSDGNQGFEVNPNSGSEVRLNAYDRTNSAFRIMRIKSSQFYWENGSTIRFSIDGSGNGIFEGNVTAYGSASDIRLKENVEVIPDALDKVKKLDGVTFNYKKDGSRSTGLIAQQLQEVLKEAVYETSDAEGKEEHLAIRYGNVVGLLVEAIKEQSDQIETLNKRIEELEHGNY
jgi:hypothetical protein